MPKPRNYLWKQTAEELLQDLIQTPEAKIPGIRAASIKYQVSKGTIIQAFRHMEGIGVLEPASQGMKRRVNQKILRKIAAQRSKKLHLALFIARTPLDDSSELMHVVYQATEKMCAARSIELKFIKSPSDPAELKALIRRLNPQMMVLYVLSPADTTVIASMKIPAVGIGSSCPLITRVSTPYEELVLAAFRKAREHGHQRICAPLWNKPGTAHQRLSSVLENHFAQCGQKFSPNYHLPFLQGHSVQEFHQCLEPLFRLTPPTCMILSVFSDLLMTNSFLTSKNLTVPDDVSVILLSQDHHLRYMLPTIAHFDLSPSRIAEIALQLLIEQTQEPQPPRETFVPPVWIKGDSLANVRSR
ncbi:MAG: substrate-binding domain-containing protein [Akkermansiaceae bacterium]|nr:substrate-binding domain-containing protein [Akkermansiaceae bacterium]